jgi:hypothetical protein
MASELEFCRHLLTKFEAFWQSNKAPYLGPFRQLVDEVHDNVPEYYNTVDEPMDLALMSVKLTNGLYGNAPFLLLPRLLIPYALLLPPPPPLLVSVALIVEGILYDLES